MFAGAFVAKVCAVAIFTRQLPYENLHASCGCFRQEHLFRESENFVIRLYICVKMTTSHVGLHRGPKGGACGKDMYAAAP